MRILIAPDKFKGTLTAAEAAAAMRRGVERAARELGIEVEVDECPVADGGEGTLEAIAPMVPGFIRSVTSALEPTASEAVPVEWGYWRETRGALTGVVESAMIIGHSRVQSIRRDPEILTTFGLGTLISAAVFAHCQTVLVGLGGSATVDGGIGMAQSIGWGDFNADPRERHFDFARDLRALTTLPRPSWDRTAERKGIEFLALCDVQNPLLGPRGAARMFGPQKGATPEQVERLEAGLENLVRVCRECNIPCDPDQPGAGAAGGLGFGLATFLGAKLIPGAPYILDLLNSDERCAQADLVITGEGKMDMQTAEGKACAEVAKRAERAGKPCIAIVGTTEGDPEALCSTLASGGIRFRNIHRVTDHALENASNTKRAAADLEAVAFQSMLEHLRK